eukprot:ANDGO_07763.mRNA.1 Putative mitochondrial ATP-dependent helicase irc3
MDSISYTKEVCSLLQFKKSSPSRNKIVRSALVVLAAWGNTTSQIKWKTIRDVTQYYTVYQGQQDEANWIHELAMAVEERASANLHFEEQRDDFFFNMTFDKQVGKIWNETTVNVSALRTDQFSAIQVLHSHFRKTNAVRQEIQNLIIHRHILRRRLDDKKILMDSQEASVVCLTLKLRSVENRLQNLVRTQFPLQIQLPMGAGKTGVAVTLPFGLSNGRVLFVAANRTIGIATAIDASWESPTSFLRKNNVIGSVDHAHPRVAWIGRNGASDDKKETEKRLTSNGVIVVSPDCLNTLSNCSFVVTTRSMLQQTSRVLQWFTPSFFDTVIVDESHHAASPTYVRIWKKLHGSRFVYMTGTSKRADGKVIRAKTVYSVSRASMLESNIWKTITVNIIDVERMMIKNPLGMVTRFLSTDEVRRAGYKRWVRQQVAWSTTSILAVVGRVLEILDEKNQQGSEVRHQAILQACNLKHAVKILHLFNTHAQNHRGFRAIAIGSRDDPETGEKLATERQNRLDRFGNGEYDAIVHVGTLGEGYNNPALSICGILRPFASRQPLDQLLGRIIRVFPADTPGLRPEIDNRAVIVTHSALGLNTMIRKYVSEGKHRPLWKGVSWDRKISDSTEETGQSVTVTELI